MSNETEQQILEVLGAANREFYGLDLVLMGVSWLNPLYVVLGHMEESGLIEGREDDSDPPRRLYRITDAGRTALLPTATVVR